MTAGEVVLFPSPTLLRGTAFVLLHTWQFDLYDDGISTTTFPAANRQRFISVSPFHLSIWRRQRPGARPAHRGPLRNSIPFWHLREDEICATRHKLLGLKYTSSTMGETEGSFDYVMDPAASITSA